MSEDVSKVKVVHLITLLEFGGAQGNTIYTVKNLNPEKFETFLWCGSGGYWDREMEESLGGEGRLHYVKALNRALNPFKDLWALFHLIFLLKKHKPKILHTHSSKAGILGRIAGWICGVPLILHTFHGFGFNDHQSFLTRSLFIGLEKMCARLSHGLIFVSESNLEEAKDKKIGNPNDFHLIRSGIPVKSLLKLSPKASGLEIKKKIGIPLDHKIISTIGAFKPQKNLKEFLEISRQILQKKPKTSFLVIGDGTLRPQLEDKIGELDLGASVHLLGWRKDVPHLLGISDVFVLTSLWEGLPRALIEALILKVPSVCYSTDGVIDVLGKSGGYMVRRGDQEIMVNRIIQILEEGSGKSFISNEFHGYLTQEFDIDHMVRKQEDLYLSTPGIRPPMRFIFDSKSKYKSGFDHQIKLDIFRRIK